MNRSEKFLEIIDQKFGGDEVQIRQAGAKRVNLVSEENARIMEENRIRAEALSRLAGTGIIDLFESMRDGSFGETKISHEPGRNYEVYFAFDYVTVGLGECHYNYVKTYFENDKLIVSGKEKMVVGESLGVIEAVGRAMDSPSHFCNETKDVDLG